MMERADPSSGGSDGPTPHERGIACLTGASSPRPTKQEAEVFESCVTFVVGTSSLFADLASGIKDRADCEVASKGAGSSSSRARQARVRGQKPGWAFGSFG